MKMLNVIEVKWLGTKKQQINRKIDQMLIDRNPISAIKYYHNDVLNRKIGIQEAKRHVEKIRLRLVYEGKIPYDHIAEYTEGILIREGITRIGKHKIPKRSGKCEIV